MSQLTQGAQDLRDAQQRLKTGNFVTDFLIDRIEDSVQSDGKGGTKTTGGWGFLGDRLGIDSTEIRERKGAFDTRVETDNTIDKSGATRQELEEAAGKPITRSADVSSALRALNKSEAQALVDDQRGHEATVRGEGYKQGLETLAIQQKHSSDQLTAQLASQDKRFLMQLEDNAEGRRADRELRRDQQAYQNRALDLKEARLDRKDRQAAIQQMMAGLAQMGASIAI
jgi:hypothetical protein